MPHTRRHLPPFLRMSLAALIALSLLSASCSSGDDDATAAPDDDTESASDNASDSASDNASSAMLEAVYEQIEGLDPEARQATLLELAEAEDRDVRLYTIVNLDDTAAILDEYESALDLEAEVFRARSEALLQRVLEENDAGRRGFDVVILSAPEMILVDDEGILGPLDTPYTDGVVASTVNENWSGVYLNVFTAAWNSDIVEPGQEPATWEDVLTSYPGALGLEAGDFDWFATLVEDYFVAELGYAEDEAVDLFRAAAAAGRVVDGHTVLTELLGAGEFDVVSSAYQHGVERIKNDGSPVEWQPAVEPLVVRPTGIAIQAETDAPATSLLFVDWLLSDEGQAVLASRFRTPASTNVQGGLPPGLDVLNVDVVELDAEREKWESLYEEIIRSG